MLKTDLNKRERVKFASALRGLGKAATRLAEALEAENDTEALTHMIIIGLTGLAVDELLEIFITAIKKDVNSSGSDEFDKIAEMINRRGK